jgi:hypothetical protein
MTLDKSLLLEDGSHINWFPKKTKYFVNKTIIIYGKRRSGKSFLVEDILYICRDVFSSIFVIALSIIANNPYQGKVPNICVKSDMSIEWGEKFMTTQKERARLYKIANDPNILESIFNKINNSQANKIAQKIKKDAVISIQNIKHNPNLNHGRKFEDIHKIEKLCQCLLIDHYKTTIRAYKNTLCINMRNSLSDNEKIATEYLDFNPHTVLVLDDCASKFKKWCRESDAMKQIFYEGRHYYITLIITAQADNEILPELRKNTSVIAFTTDQAASTTFQRSSDSFPKYIRTRASLCIKRIFKKETQGGKNYKKLIYYADNDDDIDDPFFYTIADYHSSYRVGCPAIWELNEKITRFQTNSHQEDKDFFKKYL